jgi:hypothetical protein
MQTSRLIVALAASATAACSASSGARASEHEVLRTSGTSVTLLPPAVDLTGNWATGTGPEPATARITLHPDCTYNPPVWVIRQTGNLIEAWAFAGSYNQGIVTRNPGVARVKASPGTISGFDVDISDGPTRYVLRYDNGSGHLRGTRDGTSFWAVRQVVVRTQSCPGVP